MNFNICITNLNATANLMKSCSMKHTMIIQTKVWYFERIVADMLGDTLKLSIYISIRCETVLTAQLKWKSQNKLEDNLENAFVNLRHKFLGW